MYYIGMLKLSENGSWENIFTFIYTQGIKMSDFNLNLDFVIKNTQILKISPNDM